MQTRIIRLALIGALVAGAPAGGIAQRSVAPSQESLITNGDVYAPALAVEPDAPPLPREFRGVWIATVDNIDWPS